jgi:subtilisin-like proprotein convertase family protein
MDEGMCGAVSEWGVFSEQASASIPDDGTNVLTRTIVASNLATVDTDVVVNVELTHPDASELMITLTNPSNNEVMVWNYESAPADSLHIERVPVGFSGDESVNGTWTLTVSDGTTGNQGTLVSWSVEIMSRWD